MADKDKVNKFMELRLFKEEYVAKLEAIGIEDVDDLAEALASEERVAEIHEHLKGVGPKTIEHWREDLGVELEAEAEGGEEQEEEPAPKPKKTRKVKDDEEKEAEADEGEEKEVKIEEEGGYKVKLKPKLSKETIDALSKRAEVDGRRPEFLRQEWYKRKRLQGAKWRKPRGMHSKMRQHYAYRRNVVSIGYGSPKEARYLHPSGFKEVMVHNVKDLARINPETEAARVAHPVGMKKRLAIEAKADELKIRVLNRSG
jgi:large subunit ribosomal protein L32e